MSEFCKSEPRRLEDELAALDARIERALDLAIELGDIGVAKDRLRSLRAERERLVGSASCTYVAGARLRGSYSITASASRSTGGTYCAATSGQLSSGRASSATSRCGSTTCATASRRPRSRREPT